eukprot:scaffold219_cov394-Pavlova_lutheri.AAC.3
MPTVVDKTNINAPGASHVVPVAAPVDGLQEEDEASSGSSARDAWIVEVLYRFGLVLLGLLDRFPGKTREKLLVSFFRCKGTSSVANIKTICLVCRAVEKHRSLWQRLGQYRVEEYFSRFLIPAHVLQSSIDWIEHGGRCREAESPDRAISNDPAFLSCRLFVLLYSAPSVLESGTSRMRGLVELFFHDNWILSHSLGETVDISVAWAPYKAANQALSSTLSTSKAKKLATLHTKALGSLEKQILTFVTNDDHFEDCVLTGIQTLLDIQRSAHASLRWIVLHSLFSANRKIVEAVRSCCIGSRSIFEFLLLVSKFDHRVNAACRQLGKKKQVALNSSLDQAKHFITTLLDLMRPSENLHDAEDYEDAVTQLAYVKGEFDTIQAAEMADIELYQTILDQAQELEWSNQYFLQNSHMNHYLAETCTHLARIVRILGSTKSECSVVHDCESMFVWAALLGRPGNKSDTTLTTITLECLKDPSVVSDIGLVYLKVKAGMDTFLKGMPGHELDNLDVSTEQFYSTILNKYIVKVLEDVPFTIFHIVSDLLVFEYNWMHTSNLAEKKSSPLVRRERSTRRKLHARAFREVCRFTGALRSMNKAFAGIIRVQPEEVLDVCYRKHLSMSLHKLCEEVFNFGKSQSGTIHFSVPSRGGDKGSTTHYSLRVKELGDFLAMYQKLLEDLQDFVPMACMHVWREEFNKVLISAASSAIHRRLRTKGRRSDRSLEPPANFMERIVSYLHQMSHPMQSMYLKPLCSWYGSSGEEMLGIAFFSQLQDSMGQTCLCCIDSILESCVVLQIQEVFKRYQVNTTEELAFHNMVSKMANDMNDPYLTACEPQAKILGACDRISREHSNSLKLLCEQLAFVGQNQLLRKRLNAGIRVASEYQNKALLGATMTANSALGRSVHRGTASKDPRNVHDEEDSGSDSLFAVMHHFQKWSGQLTEGSPSQSGEAEVPHMHLLAFIITVFALPSYCFDERLSSLVREKGKDAVDAAPLIAGLATLLQCFPADVVELYMLLVAQYIRTQLVLNAEDVHHAMESSLFSTGISGATEITDVSRGAPRQALSASSWLAEFSLACGFPKQAHQEYFPPYAHGDML